ncbi:serine hydrolase [Aureisphaera galaxeae]|uniref:serine hydrolase domain-containing protein n=1 Tax=Aureisphaera galaxeae TaxID=1538023 RepID=UPI0023506570|nr:serine hydrolase [Aureisphaera galaxeae]MDC8006401.1 serine hydrolase [Aureisphaera galaxeae]
MRKSAVVLFFVLCAVSLCNGQASYVYSQPDELNDGWKTADMRSMDVDTTRIYQLFTQLRQGEHKLHSALFIKSGEVIIEEYFNAYDVGKQQDLRSVTKSIRALLLGIAIDKGFIDSVDDPISKYLKDPVPKKNLDPRKNEITIKHLITMSAGWDCNDWDKKSAGQEDRVYRKKDWVQYTLDLPMINDPGSISNYCSMGVLLLAEIISRASGMSIDTFAEKFLFQPLGIENIGWGHTSKKEVISSGKRLYMLPRDMAKIGQLILNNGMWKDMQIVSGTWIETATTPKTKITGMDYGYLWWNIPFKANGKAIVSTTATGNGGQYIMVFPEWNMVAVFTGGAYNSQEDKLPFAIMNDVFLPTFIDNN